MLKLFRKIRQRLLTENKFSKYLLYAIGEIALVMIGILLALQVNNWNEGRKEIQKEIKILNDIQNDITKNINNINEGIEVLQEGEVYSINILSAFENQLAYDPNMAKNFIFYNYYWDPDFTDAAFENLKNEGVNLISNDSLRNKIIELFEIDMDILDVSDLNRHNEYMTAIGTGIINTHLYFDWKTATINTFDYTKMMSDNAFYAFTSFFLNNQRMAITKFDKFVKKAQMLNMDIQSEIKHIQ